MLRSPKAHAALVLILWLGAASCRPASETVSRLTAVSRGIA